MPFFITKTSGEKEPFSLRKFRRSLKKAGADSRTINHIIEGVIALKPKTTQELHEYAMEKLTEHNRPIAARYNLKRALLDFGPAGYPFEQYVAQVLAMQQYHVETNQIVQGACVSHEVDVIASKNKKRWLVECKFHNQVGLKSDVKITLYIQARFEDIQKAQKRKIQGTLKFDQAWIVSNTKFTSEAIQYAHCVGMKLTGWSYPTGESLAEMIDAYGVHPITALTSISKRQKDQLIRNGVILCRDAEHYKDKLRQIGLKPHEIDRILQEAKAVCSLR